MLVSTSIPTDWVKSELMETQNPELPAAFLPGPTDWVKSELMETLVLAK